MKKKENVYQTRISKTWTMTQIMELVDKDHNTALAVCPLT